MNRRAVICILSLACQTIALGQWHTNAWTSTWHSAVCMSDLYHALDERARLVGTSAIAMGVRDPADTNLGSAVVSYDPTSVVSATISNLDVWATNRAWSVAYGSNTWAETNRTAWMATNRAASYPRILSGTNSATTNFWDVPLSNWQWTVTLVDPGNTNATVLTNTIAGISGTYADAERAIRETAAITQWHTWSWLQTYDAAIRDLAPQYIRDLGTNGQDHLPAAWTWESLCVAILATNLPARSWGSLRQIWYYNTPLGNLQAMAEANTNLIAANLLTVSTSWTYRADIMPLREFSVAVASNTVYTNIDYLCWPEFTHTNGSGTYWTQAWIEAESECATNGLSWVANEWSWIATNLPFATITNIFGPLLTNAVIVVTNECGSTPTIWHALDDLRDRAKLICALNVTATNFTWTNSTAWEKRWNYLTSAYSNNTATIDNGDAPGGAGYTIWNGGASYQPEYYAAVWANPLLRIATPHAADQVAWWWAYTSPLHPDATHYPLPAEVLNDVPDVHCLYWTREGTNVYNEGATIVWPGNTIDPGEKVATPWPSYFLTYNHPDDAERLWVCRAVQSAGGASNSFSGASVGDEYTTAPTIDYDYAGYGMQYDHNDSTNVVHDEYIGLGLSHVYGLGPDAVMGWSDFYEGWQAIGPFTATVRWQFNYASNDVIYPE